MKGLINTQILVKFFVLQFFMPIFFTHSQLDTLGNTTYQKVIAITSAVEDPDKQVGEFNPESSPNLPIGLVKEIGGNKYIIAIDSAYWLNDAAYFSAYMAIEFPQSDKKIAFAAKNIKFNPKGVLGGDQARLMLVSTHQIRIGPHITMELRGDGSNYVNWNCNGFQSVNLKGNFTFDEELIIPADYREKVEASFEVNVADLNNMMTVVDFSPFKIKGLNDFEVNVSSAFVDLSDYINPPSAPMPEVYHSLYPENISLWRGFYLKNFTIKLPEKISSEGERSKIYAQNMFIDDAGVTGLFGATNVLSIGAGKTDGNWGLSVDLIEIGLVTNNLNSGEMSGKIEVPFFDNQAIQYGAIISKGNNRNDANYLFTLNPSRPINAPSFFSELTLYPTTTIGMSIEEKKFKPSINLNGKWKVKHDKAKFSGVEFQNVNLHTTSPYISSGIFSLNPSSSGQAALFPISIDHIGLGSMDDKPTIQTQMSLNFGKSDNPNNISVSGKFSFLSEVERNPISDKLQWEFDRFSMHRIDIDVSVSSFSLEGFVDFREDDPIYGDGFSGRLALEVGTFLPKTTMFGMFGKMPSYKYWAIDATVPVSIPVVGNIAIDQLSGGISYHVENTLSTEDILADASEIGSTSETMSTAYVPNQSVGFGLRAGVGYKMTPETLLNGELMLALEFNEHGGLRDILFAGSAYMLTSRSNRESATSYARGLVAMSFDNVNKIFDARFDLEASFKQAFTANIWSQIYISPDLWYTHLGHPDNRCSANLYNFATASAYFMFGQNLPPMPPPPPQVSEELGAVSDGRDTESIASGNGIATGMNLHIGFDESIGFKKFSIYGAGYLGAGFDMTLYKYSPSAYCSESGDGFGANYWYLNGQLYAYGGLSVGVTGTLSGKDFDFPFIDASMAMLLQGKLPKPTYVYGGINVSARVLGMLTVNETFEFEVGDNCTILD
ncbi:hypothetical protein [Crocinitomix algicola]|uniref:hypothetical protein n=1 Tax=Crocinitomix algicola TaxID=1740263 RepID=UPI00082A3BE9|nr:hypothetical protein [Crocinitomix algicola]